MCVSVRVYVYVYTSIQPDMHTHTHTERGRGLGNIYVSCLLEGYMGRSVHDGVVLQHSSLAKLAILLDEALLAIPSSHSLFDTQPGTWSYEPKQVAGISYFI